MRNPTRTIATAQERLADVERGIAAGTWHPTPDVLTVILRHTLGIVAALQATVQTAAAVSS